MNLNQESTPDGVIAKRQRVEQKKEQPLLKNKEEAPMNQKDPTVGSAK